MIHRSYTHGVSVDEYSVGLRNCDEVKDYLNKIYRSGAEWRISDEARGLLQKASSRNGISIDMLAVLADRIQATSYCHLSQLVFENIRSQSKQWPNREAIVGILAHIRESSHYVYNIIGPITI